MNNSCHALRLICGTFRTTPTAAVEIIANVPPLDLHRKIAVITAYERYKWLKENYPLGMIIDSWQDQNWSFVHHALSLCMETGLPGDHMPLRGVEFPPHFSSYLPEVQMQLTNLTVEKHISLAKRLATLKTVPSYSTFIQCYSGGSAIAAVGAVRRGGYGAIVLYHEEADTCQEELFGPCGVICSYEAELKTIIIDIEAIGTRMDEGSAEEQDCFHFY